MPHSRQELTEVRTDWQSMKICKGADSETEKSVKRRAKTSARDALCSPGKRDATDRVLTATEALKTAAEAPKFVTRSYEPSEAE